jgi:hypothetical protein
MRGPAADPGFALAEYEALRREALESAPDGPRGHGLALFLTRGLPAWLAALTALAHSESATRGRDVAPRDAGPTLPPPARAELTRVLAGMVLGCAQAPEAP